MIITCEACNTSFNLDDKMVKPTGSKVRCSVCANVFTAFPPQAPPAEPSAPPAPAEPPPPKDAGADVADSAAAMPIAGSEPPPADAPADRAAPEEDVLDEDVGDLFAEGSDLDFALEDEPQDAVPAEEIEDAVSEALEEDAADFDISPDGGLVDESDATVIASLDDDDLRLDLAPEKPDEDAAATVIADLDQDDLNLDISLDNDADLEGTATVIANLDDETFDLESDFTLEEERTDATQAPAPTTGPQTLDDLDDLSLTLDMEPEGDIPPDDQAEAKTAEPSLDDLSLDFDLEAEEDQAETESAGDTRAGAEQEPDLSLDLDDSGPAKAASIAETPGLEDDLDLSSLEGLLDDDAGGDDDDVTLVIDDMEDAELTLDIDDEPALADSGPGDEEALEDLEFDLDGGSKAESADMDLADDADQEIDLSEIEKMLEEPDSGSAKFSSVPEQDLDLDIEASLETEKWMSESNEEDQLVVDEELDLSELESVLEDVDTDQAEEAPEDAELDLDLSDDASLGAPTETVAVDELDFDLSDFEDTPASKAADMELEFEVEEERKVEQTLEDEGLEETVAIPEPVAKPRPVTPSATEEAAAPPKPKKAKPPKKGVSKSLVFLLIIAILGGGGYGTYYLLERNGIEVPFISDYFKPKVNDPGNLKLTTFDINSKFVDNANAGKLFVVSGKVKNGYAENRGMVTLSGKIFSTGKVQVQQERVYGGNIMSDLELANLEWDKIKARLANRLGDNRSNVKIEPGQSIPFMVVFSNLPEDLEEFTIEVTGSTSLK